MEKTPSLKDTFTEAPAPVGGKRTIILYWRDSGEVGHNPADAVCYQDELRARNPSLLAELEDLQGEEDENYVEFVDVVSADEFTRLVTGK